MQGYALSSSREGPGFDMKEFTYPKGPPSSFLSSQPTSRMMLPRSFPQNGQPLPQNGYTPAQNGYPPPQNGYPPPQNGYSPVQNGYPPNARPVQKPTYRQGALPAQQPGSQGVESIPGLGQVSQGVVGIASGSQGMGGMSQGGHPSLSSQPPATTPAWTLHQQKAIQGSTGYTPSAAPSYYPMVSFSHGFSCKSRPM